MDWVIPARSELSWDDLPTSIDYGYDWVEFTFAEEKPYAVAVRTEDGTSEIYDTDGDLRIEGLADGTQYHTFCSLAATEDSFASIWYDLAQTFTTLTRTRLSVEAAETSWAWRPGFSLNAEDCFTVQIATEGEVKELPEKDQFTLSAVNEYREAVSFPLIKAGTYIVTASLAEDVADDYTLENGGVFAVTIDPQLPVPEIPEIHYAEEMLTVTLPEDALPEGVDWEDVTVNIGATTGGYIYVYYQKMTGGSVDISLQAIGEAIGTTLPARDGVDFEMQVYYSIDAEGGDQLAMGGSTAFTIPARPNELSKPESIYWSYDFVGVKYPEDALFEMMVWDMVDEVYISDAEDGKVDGRVSNLEEGKEYKVWVRIPATSNSFASAWYVAQNSYTTLIRTHLSVEAAETSWEWKQGFSLNAADCFAAQVTLQGELDLPGKDKFVLTAAKDGREVPFPLTELGTYTITASLAEDVAGDYVLDNASFTVVIGERRHEIDSREITVRPVPAQTYTGGAIYPAVSVWHGATQLVMGEDYAVSYQNNVKVGVAAIVITGMGDYAGTRLAFFDIVPPRAKDEEKPSGGSGGSTGNGGETAETTGEAQQNRLVVDENGAAMPYTYSTVEELEEATGAVLARTLAIVAGPVRDEAGAVVYDANGQPLYAARSLLLSRELLDAIASRGYTHIRFCGEGRGARVAAGFYAGG